MSPNLKFCVQFGALQYKKDIGRLEKAPRKAAKMIKGLEHQRNEARLREQFVQPEEDAQGGGNFHV